MRAATLLALVFLGAFIAGAATVADYAAKIAPLIDPAKLSTLGPRGANPRVQKITFHLATAKAEGVNLSQIAEAALLKVGVTNRAAVELTKTAMLRNVTIAERLGSLDATGMDEMRHGKAATVRRGRYAGDELSVDHIIPRVVVPELDNVIANLELMPQRANSRKNAQVGQRQRDLADKLHKAGLLSRAGMETLRNRR
ncbi:MAG TPA: hypothetical protein VGF13_12770 [Verrucomicrobiae bacterium]|jgi:hypothetical protein